MSGGQAILPAKKEGQARLPVLHVRISAESQGIGSGGTFVFLRICTISIT